MTQVATKADCITAMRTLKQRANLIIADPPYNYGQAYDSYSDNKSYTEYMDWTLSWLTAANEALDKRGTMWIFAPDEWVSEIDVAVKQKLRLHKRQHVIWAFTFGQNCRKKFTRSHCHLLYYVKDRTSFTFNPELLLVPSARQLIYKDKRADAKGRLPDDTWMLLHQQLLPYMGGDKDVWLESRVCGTFKERKNHSPNQIPVPIMERILLACSDPGDFVLDPFAGTCSSGVACAKHARKWQGYDLSKRCVLEGNRRIKEASVTEEKPAKPKSKK